MNCYKLLGIGHSSPELGSPLVLHSQLSFWRAENASPQEPGCGVGVEGMITPAEAGAKAQCRREMVWRSVLNTGTYVPVMLLDPETFCELFCLPPLRSLFFFSCVLFTSLKCFPLSNFDLRFLGKSQFLPDQHILQMDEF